MFILRKTKQVEAAHQLPHHDGKCRGLHGHTWTITVEVSGKALNSTGPKRGMLFDYYDIGILMKEHVEILDHRFLNDIYENPTSEVIAQALFEVMAPKVIALSGGAAVLSRVLVSETQNSVAEYYL
jgi:6-pyruvoyltetrahydropterin/6-carboxytetrahydropterin synthase